MNSEELPLNYLDSPSILTLANHLLDVKSLVQADINDN